MTREKHAKRMAEKRQEAENSVSGLTSDCVKTSSRAHNRSLTPPGSSPAVSSWYTYFLERASNAPTISVRYKRSLLEGGKGVY